jgi:hypothetical protein
MSKRLAVQYPSGSTASSTSDAPASAAYRAGGAHRVAFTLRFTNERTHRALKLTADLLGMSMNDLAEQAITHELTVLGADLEERLTRTVELLRDFRATDVERDIERFAVAEVTEEDPLRSTVFHDPHGVGAAFARPVE